jgi:hypothetical protein
MDRASSANPTQNRAADALRVRDRRSVIAPRLKGVAKLLKVVINVSLLRDLLYYQNESYITQLAIFQYQNYINEYQF